MVVSAAEDPKMPSVGEYVTWRSPSNIALVKYWGKYGQQLPRNASLSLTLEESFTETTVRYAKGPKSPSVDFSLDGQMRPDFAQRIQRYVDALATYLPTLQTLSLQIESTNSFPHSAGIASSASAFSALALCLCSIESIVSDDKTVTDRDFFRWASAIARLGSGSAARSLYGGAAVWGEVGSLVGSSEQYCISISDRLHREFEGFRDTILIIDGGEKSVSSTAGHSLMNHHPYATERYRLANSNLERLLMVLANGDLEQFVQIVESEAMQLHGLMMCSTPHYVLIRPSTLRAIELITKFRRDTGIPVCFTLDAGPNVHVLYRATDADQVDAFLRAELLPLCERGCCLFDHVGVGPKRLQ